MIRVAVLVSPRGGIVDPAGNLVAAARFSMGPPPSDDRFYHLIASSVGNED